MKKLSAFGVLLLIVAATLLIGALSYADKREVQKIANAAKAGAQQYTDTLGLRVDTLQDSVDFLLAKVDTLQTIVDSLGDSLGNISGGAGVSQEDFDTLEARVDTLEDSVTMLLAELDTVDCYNEIKYVWIYADQDTIDKYCPGWQLCDGTGGTPNLLNRFVLGAGGNYACSDSGGVDSLSYYIASDTVIPDSMDIGTKTSGAGSAHTHTISGLVLDSTIRYPGAGTKIYIPRLSVGTNLPTNANESSHTHDVVIGKHSHQTVLPAANTDKKTNMPPYYGLTPIMRKKWIPT